MRVIIPGVILLACFAGFCALGRWQLQRADEHRALIQSFDGGDAAAPIERPIEATELDSLRYRRIRLQGQYQASQQILLDNMTHAGQAGYQVLTPFATGEERVVLVNRGWVPADPDRSRLPAVSLPEQHAVITGRIDRLPRAAFTFAADIPDAPAALTVMSFPQAGDIERVLDRPVYPFQVLLDPAAATGFTRDWVAAGVPPERNIAYAVQWFGLAALALVLTVVLGMRTLRRTAGAGT
jgi:surfeit locus 1 family protein